MFKKILLAADGSIHSLRAADKAIEIATLTPQAFVDVVYVVDSKTSKEDVLQNWNKLDTETKRREKMAFIEQKAKQHHVNYAIKIIRGEPGPMIVKVANEHQYDLVVIGSRGLNLMQEMVLGSVSHKVAKRVKCPVLIVK
ncbi:universal stress protein [Bacillus sp. UMB0899]|nr:universal stress protein [Bacillus sp. UMB0899]